MPKNAARCLVAVFLIICAETYANDVVISVSNPSGLQGGTLSFDASAAHFFNTLDHSVGWEVYDQDSGNLQAFHVRENGNLLVTTNNGLVAGGMSFQDGEIVEINPTTLGATSFVNFENILDQSMDIEVDGFSELSDGRMAFSTGNEGIVSAGPSTGFGYTRNDVLVYDPDDMSIDRLFDGTLISGGDRFNNVNGVSVLADGRIAMAVSTGGVPDIFLAGLTFQRNDAVLFDPRSGTATMLIEGNTTFEGPPNPSIDALHVVAVPEPSTMAHTLWVVLLLPHFGRQQIRRQTS